MNTPPPIIVAHRGIHHGLPENSREAIWKAMDDQFWVECDIRAAADGVPVVMHDEALDRTTVETGPVWARTSAELTRIGLRGGGVVPTLQQCLARMIDPQLGWLIEIKPPGAHELIRRVCELARERLRWFIIQSFDVDNVRYAQEMHPWATALLVGDQRELDAALAGDWQRIHIDHRMLTAELMQCLRARRIEVGAWTVNDEADVRRVIELGVDTIISDNPWRVREAIYYLSPDEWRRREGQ